MKRQTIPALRPTDPMSTKIAELSHQYTDASKRRKFEIGCELLDLLRAEAPLSA